MFFQFLSVKPYAVARPPAWPQTAKQRLLTAGGGAYCPPEAARMWHVFLALVSLMHGDHRLTAEVTTRTSFAVIRHPIKASICSSGLLFLPYHRKHVLTVFAGESRPSGFKLCALSFDVLLITMQGKVLVPYWHLQERGKREKGKQNWPNYRYWEVYCCTWHICHESIFAHFYPVFVLIVVLILFKFLRKQQCH